MKLQLRRIGLILLSVLFVLPLFACATEPVDTDAGKDQTTQKTNVIQLKASDLTLPEGSAFSILFSEKSEQFGGIKTAVPTCGNQYLNDLIATSVKDHLIAKAPADSTAAAVDVEACVRSEELYSFSFALYYDLPNDTREVVRFWLSADVGGGALLTIGDIIQANYFEKGVVNDYVRSYLKEHYAGAYDVTKADALSVSKTALDNFFVKEAGVALSLKEEIGAASALTVYVSNAALVLYGRRGTTSETEPESNYSSDYTPVTQGEKVVAMTFDDGPGYNTTPRLLDYLEKNNFKATFFVNGYNYSNLENESAKAIVRRAVSLGCEIGNHSYSHPYFNKLTPEQRTYQLEHNADLIEAACGIYPNLFRAPGGTFPQGMPEADDYFYIYWDADGEDWKYKNSDDVNAQELANRYLKLIRSGSIVLMHDIYAKSVDAAIIIMNTLKAQGYRFVTVSELLDLKDQVPSGIIYTSQNGTRNYMNAEKNG